MPTYLAGARGGAVAFDSQYHSEDVFHPLARVNAQCLSTVYKGVHDCCSLGGFMVAVKQEVLPSQSQRPNDVLYKVVVDVKATVID